jgi:hypothetical protein
MASHVGDPRGEPHPWESKNGPVSVPAALMPNLDVQQTLGMSDEVSKNGPVSDPSAPKPNLDVQQTLVDKTRSLMKTLGQNNTLISEAVSS